MNDINEKLKGVNSVITKMTREIDKLVYVVQSIETYAGIKEEIVTIQTGEPANANTPIVIRQAVLFMDEEIALSDDDFDWRKVDKFDKWLVENDNFKYILPDAKSIVAIKPRRTDKEYTDNDGLYNYFLNKPNKATLFLIRNGDNLYRLESEHIKLDDRLFPNADEYQKAVEEEQNHNLDENYLKKSTLIQRTYTKVAFLLQGLLDRSTVFSPHNSKANFLKFDGFDDKSVILSYELDSSRYITDGHPSVQDWMHNLNSKLSEGKRIVLVKSSQFGEFQGYNFNEGAFLRTYMNDYFKPEYPGNGIYTLKKNSLYNSKDEYYFMTQRNTCRYCISYKPDGEAYSWENGYTRRKNKVNIAVDINAHLGILNYDDLDIDDLEYYLNCRLYRSKYFTYIRLLKTAKLIVEQEKKVESDFITLLEGECIKANLSPKDGIEIHSIVEMALKVVKDRLKWKRPVSSKEKETYTLVKRTLFSAKFKEKYFRKG